MTDAEELKLLREIVAKVVQEMDPVDEKGRPYVYSHPSMVVWTDKWRDWSMRLRSAIK